MIAATTSLQTENALSAYVARLVSPVESSYLQSCMTSSYANIKQRVLHVCTALAPDHVGFELSLMPARAAGTNNGRTGTTRSHKGCRVHRSLFLRSKMTSMQGDVRPVVLRRWSHGDVEVEEHAEYRTKPGRP